VILHEMGHVLGIGTIWDTLGLVENGPGGTINFTGPTAVGAYQTIFGVSDNFVPVETDGGPGTAGGHWDEETFDNELMTGFLNGGVSNPISTVTIGALADMGYTVNMAAADPYSAPSSVRTGDGIDSSSSESGSGVGLVDDEVDDDLDEVPDIDDDMNEVPDVDDDMVDTDDDDVEDGDDMDENCPESDDDDEEDDSTDDPTATGDDSDDIDLIMSDIGSVFELV